MPSSSRRDFLKTFAVATTATAGLTLTKAKAQELNDSTEDSNQSMGVLFDATLCVVCRSCEWACKEEHNIATSDRLSYQDRSVFKDFRRPTDSAYTVVNEFPNENNPLLPIDVKYQCMHCLHPGCVSACIVGAFKKTPQGAVIWDTKKCIGCRYCMVACPFQVPTFQFDKAIQPNITKCDFCYPNRTSKGKLPACVENCPVEALLYGPREEILSIAKQRIRRNPNKYYNKVMGENEVGGTSWLYLSPKEFTQIGFPKLNTKPVPGTTEAIQHGIFAYFVPPLALFAWLGGMMWYSHRRESIEGKSKDKEDNNE
jgi:Fe-S-cluster-containing dehydrogenase component